MTGTEIDAGERVISGIAGGLRVFFRQEPVLITEDRIRAYFIRESL